MSRKPFYISNDILFNTSDTMLLDWMGTYPNAVWSIGSTWYARYKGPYRRCDGLREAIMTAMQMKHDLDMRALAEGIGV